MYAHSLHIRMCVRVCVCMCIGHTDAITLSSLSKGGFLLSYLPFPYASCSSNTITSNIVAALSEGVRESRGVRARARECCVRVSAATWKRHSAPSHTTLFYSRSHSHSPALLSYSNFICSDEKAVSRKLSPCLSLLASPFSFLFWHSQLLCKFLAANGNAWVKCVCVCVCVTLPGTRVSESAMLRLDIKRTHIFNLLN